MGSLAFDSMMTHTVEFVRYTKTTGSATSYGHIVASDDPPLDVFTRRCYWRPSSADEWNQTGYSGTMFSTYTLLIARRHLPSSMLAVSTGEANEYHYIRNVRLRRNGQIIDAGPFDIHGILDVAGAQDYYRMMLRRAG